MHRTTTVAKRSLLLGVAAIITLAPAAHATVALVSQSRQISVSAFSSNGAPSDSAAAPGFGSWNESRSVTAPNGGTLGAASAGASQNSTITTNAMSGQLGTNALAFRNGYGSQASSTLNTVFTVDASTPITFAYAYTHGSAPLVLERNNATLTGPGGTLFSLFSTQANPVQLTLTPGQYTLDVSCGCFPSTDSGGTQSNVNFTLTFLPSPSAALLLSVGATTLALRRRR